MAGDPVPDIHPRSMGDSIASQLVMAGVDLRTVQELGGWRTLAMVARYSHLAPQHLHAAVERLVAQDATGLARN